MTSSAGKRLRRFAVIVRAAEPTKVTVHAAEDTSNRCDRHGPVHLPSRHFPGPRRTSRQSRSVEKQYRLQRPQNTSAWGAQSSQSDRDEPADRGFGRQPASCPEGVEAVARKLLRRDVTPDV